MKKTFVLLSALISLSAFATDFQVKARNVVGMKLKSIHLSENGVTSIHCGEGTKKSSMEKTGDVYFLEGKGICEDRAISVSFYKRGEARGALGTVNGLPIWCSVRNESGAKKMASDVLDQMFSVTTVSLSCEVGNFSDYTQYAGNVEMVLEVKN